MVVSGQLSHQKVGVTISEPWDFVTEHGSGPFGGEILATRLGSGDRDMFLIRLEKALTSGSDVWSYFVASPKTGRLSTALKSGYRAVCGLTSIADTKALSSDPFADVNYDESINLLADVVIV